MRRTTKLLLLGPTACRQILNQSRGLCRVWGFLQTYPYSLKGPSLGRCLRSLGLGFKVQGLRSAFVILRRLTVQSKFSSEARGLRNFNLNCNVAAHEQKQPKAVQTSCRNSAEFLNPRSIKLSPICGGSSQRSTWATVVVSTRFICCGLYFGFGLGKKLQVTPCYTA